VLERALVIDSWCLPADRAEGYARLVSDLNRNLTTLWARVIVGRLFPRGGIFSRMGLKILITVAIWCLMLVVLPAMCVGPTGPE
jgi:hypothetical protein